MTKPKIQKIPLKKITRLSCPKCGELMAKLYPYASFHFSGGELPMCIKCLNLANSQLNLPQGKR